jgi:hypothetical protein
MGTRLVARRRRAFATLAVCLSLLGFGGAVAVASESPLNVAVLTAMDATMDSVLGLSTTSTTDPPGFHTVKPNQFDPGRTYLVQATWLHGIGCPTNAFIAIPNADFTGVAGTAPYTSPACPTGDPGDQRNEGLLLAKTGPTNNFASAIAELKNVKGIMLTELGYDIRKHGGSGGSPLGSHCGAGAPRFNVITETGGHFLGCNSPPGVVTSSGDGWIRLRWGPAALLGAFPPITGTEVVRRIVIVFDEGTDASGGPDQFGAAVLDNIDVNGTLVGRGAAQAN